MTDAIPRQPEEEHRLIHCGEVGYMLDEAKCSCGWKSGPYFDGAEYALSAFNKHKDSASGNAIPRQPLTTAQEGVREPVAYMRRWAFNRVDVMKMKRPDRPLGWAYHEVTEYRLMKDDVPLYADEPRP